MKKALIISYYWPPAGGSGVQRISKFCKYLPDFGYEPVVLTVKDGNFFSIDETLLKDVGQVEHVHRAASLEPHAIYQRLLGKKKSAGGASVGSGGGWKRTLGEWVRLNCFIPDSRIGWKRPAITEGLRVIREHRPAVIFSTAPPYTPHLIAQKLHEASGIPWVADFRDPWLENHAYNTAPRLAPVLAANRRLENGVLENAIRVTASNPGLLKILSGKRPLTERARFKTIYNGYDAEDVRTLRPPSDRFDVSYFGTLYPYGFPDSFFDSIAGALKENEDLARDFTFNVFGQVHPDIAEKLNRAIPAENLNAGAYLPHDHYLDALYQPQVLMLLINKFPHNEATVPGKVYEFLPTGNPILGIGPANGDVDEVLRQCDAGQLLDYEDAAGVQAFLLEQYARWKAGSLNTGLREEPRFERREKARELADLFDELIG